MILTFRDRAYLHKPVEMKPSLHPISPDHWCNSANWEGLPEKQELMSARRGEVFAEIDGSQDAQTECLSLIKEVVGVGELSSFPSDLEIAAAQVRDDLCLLKPNEAGEWRLIAASLCAPSYWRLANFIGRPLKGLHAAVPRGETLSERIGTVFSNLRPDMCLERFNWTIQLGDARFTPSSTQILEALEATAPAEAMNNLFLRVERQTIRKLTRSGAVLFTIDVTLDPLESVMSTPPDANTFHAVWNGTAADVRAYKSWPHYDEVIQHFMHRFR